MKAWICGLVIVGVTGCAATVLQDPTVDEPYPSGVQITVDKWSGPSLVDSAIERVARKNGLACAREPYNGTNLPIRRDMLPQLLVCGFQNGLKDIAPLLVVRPTSDPRTVSVEIPWGYSICEGGGGSMNCECDSMEAAATQRSAPGSNSHCKCKGELHSEWQLEATARKVITDLRSALHGRISRFQVQNLNDAKGECSDLVF